MAKVLRANINKTKIGMDDGTIFEVDTSLLNFIPNEGDKVEVFRSDEEIIINKIDSKSKDTNTAERPDPITINNINNIDNNNNNYNSINNGAYEYGRRVNKVVYIALALFLGTFGGHKFYSGQFGKGIMYLLFSWTMIPSILAIISAIKALFTRADQYGYINV